MGETNFLLKSAVQVETPKRSKIKHRFLCRGIRIITTVQQLLVARAHVTVLRSGKPMEFPWLDSGGNFPAGPLVPPWRPYSNNPGIPMAIFTFNKCATGSRGCEDIGRQLVAPPYHGGPHAIRCRQEWCMLGACLFLPGWQEIIQFSNVLQHDVALNAQYEIIKIHNVAMNCGRAQLPRANTIQTVLILLPTFRKQGRAHEFS